ncbi:MAG: DUF4838 domain-containing protein, partial [Lentisphaeria bacterium]|nr:DUF4838 domain-containing protein [Lentisphaeria bacterium]
MDFRIGKVREHRIWSSIEKCFICVSLLLCVTLAAGTSKRNIRISGDVEKFSDITIVKGNKKPLIGFAAAEMQNMIFKAVGKKPQIVNQIMPGRLSIVLGDCGASRKAGLDITKLPPEGFYIRRNGNVIYIAGRDHASYSPAVKKGFSVAYPRGTLTGVYDFLERFTGARFFFAGPMGTVVPAKGAVYLPRNIDIMDSPDMFFRLFSFHEKATGKYYKGYREIKYPADIRSIRQDILPRYRAMERGYTFGHGLNGLDLVRRFAKSNPEYFALRHDGKRYSDPRMSHTGQLCFSSGVREVIIQDAIAYFSGKPAKSRGMKNWSYKTVAGDVFGIMPQDGMYWCRCEKCKKIWDGKGKISDEKARKAISNFMFRFYAEVCNSLAKAGLKHRVATMAYLPYDIAPDFPLPKEL